MKKKKRITLCMVLKIKANLCGKQKEFTKH